MWYVIWEHQESRFHGLPFCFAGRLRAEKRTGSFTALMSALTSVVSGGPDAVADAAAVDLPYHRLELGVDVEHLDICHLGHHKYVPFCLSCRGFWLLLAFSEADSCATHRLKVCSMQCAAWSVCLLKQLHRTTHACLYPQAVCCIQWLHELVTERLSSSAADLAVLRELVTAFVVG